MKNRLFMVFALLLPIAVLVNSTWLQHQQRTTGETVTFPIEGFDPRDLLSGHYLSYRIDYGITETSGCPTTDIRALLCLAPERSIYPIDELPENCTQFMHGNCNSQARFMTGLERFYIPEQHAEVLDRKVRNNKGKLVVSVDQNGNAGIVDLLINDQSWKTQVTETKAE